MKNYVLLVITLFVGSNLMALPKTIEFANKSKSYEIAVMTGNGKAATTRIGAAKESPVTKRLVYPSKKLKVDFEPIRNGEKLQGTIALQAYDQWGVKAHDEPKYYTIQINKISEMPNIKLEYGIFGYSFDADKKLHLKTNKTTQFAPKVKLEA